MSRILGIRPTRTNDEYAVMVRRMLGQQKAPKRRERITPEQLCERLYGVPDPFQCSHWWRDTTFPADSVNADPYAGQICTKCGVMAVTG